MFFQSAGFLFAFLPAALLALALSRGPRLRTATIVTLSYVFYSGGDPIFVLLLFTSSVVDYAAALRLHATRERRRRAAWLALSIATNLLILGTFKYGTMVARNTAPLFSALGLDQPSADFVQSFVLPAGISFYTFQSMSYTIDVYRGTVQPTRDFAGFLSFVAYLPQLIAGPIERFGRLYPQLRALAERTAPVHWSAGLDRLALGIAQKLLIADSCGRVVENLASWPGPYDLVSAWLLALGFGMQIYYDFAGYTNMAIGVSLLLGVRLSENFLSPYKASSIQDFWRRWHVTLSMWFRDYVYIPLGGFRGSRLRTGLNVMLTMALCGLWHGAAWNFVAWGVGHGALLAGHRTWRALAPAVRLPAPVAIGLTFVAVHLLWVLFRFDDVYQVVAIWRGMVGLGGLAAPVMVWDLVFVASVTALTWVAPSCAERWPGRSGAVESFALSGLALFAILISPQIHQFIYFRF